MHALELIKDKALKLKKKKKITIKIIIINQNIMSIINYSKTKDKILVSKDYKYDCEFL